MVKLVLVAMGLMTIYGASYCWMRAKGRICIIEEGDSTKTYVRLEVGESDEFRKRVWNLSIVGREFDRLAEREIKRKRHLRILFSSLMFIEATARETLNAVTP